MADINSSTEDLISSMIDLARQNKLTTEDLEKLNNALQKNLPFVQKFTNALKNGSLTLGKEMESTATSVARGNTEFSAMKDIVNAAGKALSGLAEAIPFVGTALSGLTKAAVKVSTIAIDRLQVSFNAFQELSQQGLIGAKGISGLRQEMVNARVPIEKFQKILSESAGDLVYFRGTAVTGAKSLSNVLTEMQTGQGKQLRRLGFSITEIGNTVVEFQKTQRRMGFLQTMSTDQLTQATTKYGEELDMVAKLTGQSRKEIQQNRDRLLADTRFRAWQTQQEGKLGQQRARRIMDFIGGIHKLAPMMSEGIKDLFASGGAATSDAGRRLIQQGMGPAIMSIRKQMMNGSISVAQAQKELFKASQQNRDRFRDVSALVGDFGAGIPFQEMADLASQYQLSSKDIKNLNETQRSQIKGSDKLTDHLTDATMNLQKAQVQLDDLATSLSGADKIVNVFASTMESTIHFIHKEILGQSQKEIKASMKSFRDQTTAKKFGIAGEMKNANFVTSDTALQKELERQQQITKSLSEMQLKKKQMGLQWTKSQENELETINQQKQLSDEKLKFLRTHQEKAGNVVASIIKSAGVGQQKDWGFNESLNRYLKKMGWTQEKTENITPQEKRILENIVSKYKKSKQGYFGTGKATFDLPSESIEFPKGFANEIQSKRIQSAGDQLALYDQKKREFNQALTEVKKDNVITTAEQRKLTDMNKELARIAAGIDKLHVLNTALINETRRNTDAIKQGPNN